MVDAAIPDDLTPHVLAESSVEPPFSKSFASCRLHSREIAAQDGRGLTLVTHGQLEID